LSLSGTGVSERNGSIDHEGTSASSATCIDRSRSCAGSSSASADHGERIDRGGTWSLCAGSHHHGFSARGLNSLRAILSWLVPHGLHRFCVPVMFLCGYTTTCLLCCFV
ncbi:unnamed protein product, partial [Musa acuminata subsp. burmannicoides]